MPLYYKKGAIFFCSLFIFFSKIMYTRYKKDSSQSPMSRSSPTSRRSFSVPNAADHRNARRNLYEESFTYERESDMLNIDDIDHEAIQNDAELRGRLKNVCCCYYYLIKV